MRVPVPTGSIVDLTILAKRKTTVEEINNILINASKDPSWSGILAVSEIPLVSTDIIGNTHASIVDLSMTALMHEKFLSLVRSLCSLEAQGSQKKMAALVLFKVIK